jgi:t-SNARE complex subunit (syntaxin)
VTKPRALSASEIRPSKAIRLTETDLKRLDNNIEKSVLRLAERFGECDGTIERMLDNFLADTRRWADELREYMKERTADGETWEL